MTMIIAKQTAAATATKQFTHKNLLRTIVPVGVLAAETIAVNILDEDGVALPLYDDLGAAVVLSATSAPLKINYPINLQFVKGITANAVGVMMME